MARKEKQYHFIYKTTCLLNSKYYYGMHSTDELNDGYYGSGRRLKRSLNKYGKENHKVEYLEFLPDRKSLIEREKEIVSLNEIAKENCMNLMIGGKGGFISDEQQKYRSACGGKACEEKRKTNPTFKEILHEKRSEAAKINYALGKYINKNFNNFANRKHNDNAKMKMRNSHLNKGIGDNNSQYNTCWITNGVQNKKIKKSNINSIVFGDWKLGRTLNRTKK